MWMVFTKGRLFVHSPQCRVRLRIAKFDLLDEIKRATLVMNDQVIRNLSLLSVLPVRF
jgi:hypothetical protein